MKFREQLLDRVAKMVLDAIMEATPPPLQDDTKPSPDRIPPAHRNSLAGPEFLASRVRRRAAAVTPATMSRIDRLKLLASELLEKGEVSAADFAARLRRDPRSVGQLLRHTQLPARTKMSRYITVRKVGKPARTTYYPTEHTKDLLKMT